MRRCSECGRPARAYSFGGKLRSKRSRARQLHAMKDHDLCYQCYERVVQAFHAQLKKKRKPKMPSATLAPPLTAATLRVHRLQISNLMRISALTIEARGRHVEISGPNGSGKSSALDAIWLACGGRTAPDKPEPVHRGQSKGFVRLDLEDETGKVVLTIERQYAADRKDSKLILRAPDGAVYARPQQLLDTLFDVISLDPTRFLSARPQDQADEVLRVMDIQCPISEVQEIAGEKILPKDGESAAAYLSRLSGDDVGVFYDRRKQAGRIADQKAKAWEEQLVEVNRLGGQPAEGEVASLSELLEERKGLEQRGAERAALGKISDETNVSLESYRGQLEMLQAQSTNSLAQVRRIEAQITELKKQLVAEVDAAAKLAKRIENGLATIAACERDAKADRDAFDAAFDPAADLAGLDRRIREIEADNELVGKRRQAHEHWVRLGREAEGARAEKARADLVLERLRGLRKSILEGIDLGVPGLEIGDSELRLNGVSFKQASKGESIRVACALSMKRNPKIRVLRLDNAEQLDDQTLALVRQLADAQGWEVISARVANGEELAVVFSGEE